MSQDMIVYIIIVHTLCFFIGFGIIKSFPKLGLIAPDKMSILLAAGLGLIGAWIFTLGTNFKKFPPPIELPNHYFEGKIFYIDSGKTPRDVSSILVIKENNGSRNTVQCKVPTSEWLKKGAIPCGFDDIAYQTFKGGYGKVWYYNDLDYSNSMDGRYNTRYIVTQISIDNKLQFPYSIQYRSIIASLEENENPLKKENLFLNLFVFSFFFTFIFLLVIAFRLKTQTKK